MVMLMMDVTLVSATQPLATAPLVTTSEARTGSSLMLTSSACVAHAHAA